MLHRVYFGNPNHSAGRQVMRMKNDGADPVKYVIE